MERGFTRNRDGGMTVQEYRQKNNHLAQNGDTRKMLMLRPFSLN
jgi:hypothetical protein